MQRTDPKWKYFSQEQQFHPDFNGPKSSTNDGPRVRTQIRFDSGLIDRQIEEAIQLQIGLNFEASQPRAQPSARRDDDKVFIKMFAETVSVSVHFLIINRVFLASFWPSYSQPLTSCRACSGGQLVGRGSFHCFCGSRHEISTNFICTRVVLLVVAMMMIPTKHGKALADVVDHPT